MKMKINKGREEQRDNVVAKSERVNAVLKINRAPKIDIGKIRFRLLKRTASVV